MAVAGQLPPATDHRYACYAEWPACAPPVGWSASLTPSLGGRHTWQPAGTGRHPTGV